jgi:predicted metal-dependent HD superfamily phosphohydrolase
MASNIKICVNLRWSKANNFIIWCGKNVIMDTIQKAEAFVRNLLKDKLSAVYSYHNLEHTLRVVRAASEIAKSENLTENQYMAVMLAAWFHDTGYIEGAENHEHRSAAFFRDFAVSENINTESAALAESLILVTEYTKTPSNNLEYIIRDADTAHFATSEFQSVSDSLRKEWDNEGKTYNDLAWLEGNLMMLTQKHQYYSEYAKKHWDEKKIENIENIRKKIKQLKATNMDNTDEPDKKTRAESELTGGKKKKERTERGVETMFKTTSQNHTQLSQIADSKANILLSVNAIIISISLSTLIPKLDSPTNAHLVLPTFILLMFSVASIIFAILSTRPKVTSGSFTRDDIEKRKANLLFFGNFHKMPYEEYEWAMNEVMKDPEYLYNSMIKDLYYLGLVLNRKYKLLRITYNIFMAGIIISCIAFVIAFQSIR